EGLTIASGERREWEQVERTIGGEEHCCHRSQGWCERLPHALSKFHACRTRIVPALDGPSPAFQRRLNRAHRSELDQDGLVVARQDEGQKPRFFQQRSLRSSWWAQMCILQEIN